MEKWCKTHKRWERDDDVCGSRFNKALRTAQLNAHLYNQAGRVTKERTDQAHFVRQARIEAKRAASA